MQKLQLTNARGFTAANCLTEKTQTTLDTPAIEYLKEFCPHTPTMVEPNFSAEQAMCLLPHLQPAVLLVAKEGQLLGLVTDQQLNQQELIKKSSAGYDRQDLTVADFLTDQLLAVNSEALTKATVGGLLDAMADQGSEYCLVADTARSRVQGLISARGLAAQITGPVIRRHQKPQIQLLATQLYHRLHPQEAPSQVG